MKTEKSIIKLDKQRISVPQKPPKILEDKTLYKREENKKTIFEEMAEIAIEKNYRKF